MLATTMTIMVVGIMVEMLTTLIAVTENGDIEDVIFFKVERCEWRCASVANNTLTMLHYSKFVYSINSTILNFTILKL